MQPTAVLRALADLAAVAASASGNAGLPEGVTPEAIDVTRTGEPPVWLGTSLMLPFDQHLPPSHHDGFVQTTGSAQPRTIRSTRQVTHLAGLDALQPAERLLRVGWVVVTGRATVHGRERTVCVPLVSQPVRINAGLVRSSVVVPLGPPELTPLVTDPAEAARLEADVQYGGGALHAGGDPTAALIARLPRLQAWIREVVAAASLPPVATIHAPGEDPIPRRTKDGLVAVVGALLYVSRDQFRPSVEASLRSWAARDDLGGTAFGHLYGGATPSDIDPRGAGSGRHGADLATTGVGDDEAVCAPLPLNVAQADAVRRARHEPVVALSGPPGSGKSHAVAAIASDTVTRGGTVLVATRSGHAADVIAGLLDRQAGPDPVRFGGADADDLVRQITLRGASRDDVRRARDALDDAMAARAITERAIVRTLELETSTERAAAWDGLVHELRAVAPALFSPDSDLDAIADLFERCDAPADSWWRRWRARRAGSRLRASMGAAPSTSLAELRTALRCATDRRDAAVLAAGDGTTLGPLWHRLLLDDAAVRSAAGRVAEVEAAREDRRRGGRAAAGALATALRAGRRRRRALLRQLRGPGTIVQALPLWVGTLRDVEDLLPEAPGLFDLVILDEASQIDQTLAAGTLLRGERAVVVGDPRQLRHVSFLGDEQVREALAANGLSAVAAALDVRRASILDVAAGVTPVTWLDEHYRSVPHLIEFSARRFYDGRLTVATRHPSNEAADVIDIVRVPAPGSAGDAGAAPTSTEVATHELRTAIEVVRGLVAAGHTDVAVVTPFREIADAAQEALLDAFPVEAVENARLRVGTVHAFQGAEADHVVLVLGLSPGDPAGRRRFVEDPHLFNVMVTRARRRLTVVTSQPPKDASAGDGLVEQYLTHADRPPAPPSDGRVASAWSTALGRELAAVGLDVRAGYPVGRWSIDLCVGGAEGAAVDTGVHPDGPAAHVARHRMLAAAGWRQLDGYPSRWDGDPTRAAVELAGELSARSSHPPEGAVPTGGSPER